MLLGVHAICGSASAPTAEHQRRPPRTAGDREGKQNPQIIGALIERFRHFSDLFLHLVALIPAKKILTRRRLIPGQPLVASRTTLAPPRRRSQTRRRNAYFPAASTISAVHMRTGQRQPLPIRPHGAVTH
jgi:hypothetical protein